MIKKERTISTRIKLEEALLRELPPDHKKRPEIQSSLRKNLAGYKGEKELDYHLSFLPDESLLIFNDLRLPRSSNPQRFFQIDTLLLSPKFIVLIESKNIYGQLFFDSDTKQVIRTFDGKKEGFSDPLLQVERQKIELQRWLTHKQIPIFCFVSIGHPSTILETQPENNHIFNQILHAEHLYKQILGLMASHKNPILTTYQVKKMSERLLNEHTPEEIDILDLYNITADQFTRGISCPTGLSLHPPLLRVHGKWICQKCGFSSKNIHIQALEDYLLLNGTITNQACRERLNLEKHHGPTVTRLLNEMKVLFTGTTKDRIYYRTQPPNSSNKVAKNKATI